MTNLENQTVEIIDGKNTGLVGTVIATGGRGWLTVDTDDGEVKVRQTQVEVMGSELPEGKRTLASQVKKYMAGYEMSVSAGGHIAKNCGDDLAHELSGKSLQQVREIAMAELPHIDWAEKYAKYAKLNDGHIRMILGNMIRANRRKNGEV